MDANGTRFHLLLGKGDWRRCTEEMDGQERTLASLWDVTSVDGAATNLYWEQERYELTLQPRLFQFVPAPRDKPPALADRRGAGRDRFGNWYWIDATGREILVNSAGTQTRAHFWSVGDGIACEQSRGLGDFVPTTPMPELTPLQLRGLAVTEDHYLVVGVLQPAGLLIFDLHAGGPPQQVLWPKLVAFAPFDMSPMPGGGVWILDRDVADPLKPARYWALDRHFNVIPRDQSETTLVEAQEDAFQPTDGSITRRTARRTFPQGISLEASSPVSALDAIAIEGLPDGTVLILDRNAGEGFSRIYRYEFGTQLGDPVSTEVMSRLIEHESPPRFALIGHDFAFVPEHDGPEHKVADRLYVVAANGNQSFAFNITQEEGRLRLEPLGEYLPMRLFGGRGLVAAGTQLYYDIGDGWVPLIEQRRPRYVPEATLRTPRLDGGEPDCVWHRLLLEACLPPETEVRVWSRATNEPRDLPFTAWQPEPDFYLRGDGSELPFAPRMNAAGYGIWELLFQRVRGRYLQLKLRLSGNGRTTPRLRALRIYYPRFSYLEHYMPGVYRDDEQSASFLDRFLANLEGFYTSLEDKIAAVQLLFDVRSAPQESLAWLAGWFGVALDPVWDEGKRRLFIQHAMDFFQYRGTIHGLRMALRLTLDECADDGIFTDPPSEDPRQHGIRIIEQYRTRRTPSVVVGDPTELSGLPEVSQAARWLPVMGRAELHNRYRRFLQQRYRQAEQLPVFVPFPLRNPAWQKAPVRQQPTVGTPSSVPIAAPEDQALWQDFLARRYLSISALNEAHGRQFIRFTEVPIPDHLPPDSVLLQDWNAFLTEKAAVWQQFAQGSLGFVPSAVPEEAGLWQRFLASRYPDIDALNDAYRASYTRFEDIRLPSDLPAEGAPLQDWNDFLRDPAASAAAVKRKRWQDFLARRYRRVGALNQAYGTRWTTFEHVSLLDDLPPDSGPLQDWYQFEGVVLAMHRTAHRFTVLLPIPKKYTSDVTEHQRRRELAARIIDLEKPAHTTFDVRFYWAMFLVGGVRLGKDTVLDVGSRAPQLMSPLVLGQASLAEGYLAPMHPQNVTERLILGRDQLRG